MRECIAKGIEFLFCRKTDLPPSHVFHFLYSFKRGASLIAELTYSRKNYVTKTDSKRFETKYCTCFLTKAIAKYSTSVYTKSECIWNNLSAKNVNYLNVVLLRLSEKMILYNEVIILIYNYSVKIVSIINSSILW